MTFTASALDALYAAADGYPYFVQAYGKVTWDVAASSPVTAADVNVAAPEAESPPAPEPAAPAAPSLTHT